MQENYLRFINTTGKTIYLSDIKQNISFLGHKEQEISLDHVKKSQSFKAFVMKGDFAITACGDSIFEMNLFRLQKYKKETKQQTLLEDSTTSVVKIRGHFFDAGGYSKTNRNLVRGLLQNGIQIELDPVNNQTTELPECETIFYRNLIKHSSPKIAIDSVVPIYCQKYPDSIYPILYTTVESTTIPQQFIDGMKLYKEIWTTSSFCQQVLNNYGFTNTYVISNSINTDMYCQAGNKLTFDPPLKNFVFVSVFAWNYRKGYDVLIKSFLREFTSKDDVSLLLVTRPYTHSDGQSEAKTFINNCIESMNIKNPPHIVIYDKLLPEEKMPALYRSCNAFVLFTRGEGFALPFAESALCGLPVIATNFSGQTDYLTYDNSYFLEIDKLCELPVGATNVHFWDKQLFPALTSKHVTQEAQKLLRHVFDNQGEAQEKNKKLQQLVKERYNIDTIAKKAKSRICSIFNDLIT